MINAWRVPFKAAVRVRTGSQQFVAGYPKQSGPWSGCGDCASSKFWWLLMGVVETGWFQVRVLWLIWTFFISTMFSVCWLTIFQRDWTPNSGLLLKRIGEQLGGYLGCNCTVNVCWSMILDLHWAWECSNKPIKQRHNPWTIARLGCYNICFGCFSYIFPRVSQGLWAHIQPIRIILGTHSTVLLWLGEG